MKKFISLLRLYLLAVVLFITTMTGCQLFYPEFFIDEIIDHRGDTNWTTNDNRWHYVGTQYVTAVEVSSVSIDVDETTGIPYVAFQDSGKSNKLSVMRYTNSNWEYVGSRGFTPDSVNYVNLDCSGGKVFVTCVATGLTNKLLAYVRESGVWTSFGTANISPRAGASLFVDSGIPFVAYSERTNWTLQVRKYTGSWVDAGSGEVTSGIVGQVAVTASGGTPYVVYQDMAYLGYCSVSAYNGSAWEQLGSPGFSEGTIAGPCIAMSGTAPYVAYQDTANDYKATVMRYSGFGWAAVGGAGFTPDIAASLDLHIENGILFLAFQDGISLAATVMINSNGTWTNLGERGFSGGAVGSLSMAVRQGRVYAAFADASTAGSNRLTVMDHY